MSIQIGNYVTYKSNKYIVTQVRQGNLLLILSPTGKLQVKVTSVQLLALPPAKVVEYNLSSYLVTGKNLIISLTTSRIMKWGEHDGNRKQILAASELQ